MNCSVAQCVEVIGDWWTVLILRDVFLGVRRFDEIQDRLGVSRNVLAQRLDLLVEQEILERRPYQEHPRRYDYVLTPRGRDLWPVLTAMRQWGDTWAAPNGTPVQLLHTACGHPTTVVQTCAQCGEELSLRELRMIDGPGAGDNSPLPDHLRHRRPTEHQVEERSSRG